MNTAFDHVEIGPRSTAGTPGTSARLHAAGHQLRFARNSSVYDFGDPAQAVFRVREGLVRIARVTPDGRTHTIRHILPRDFFGEDALTSPMHTETSEALTDVSVQAYDLRYLDVHDLWVIARSLSSQIHRMMDFSYHLQTGDVMERVARYLLSLSRTPLSSRDAAGRPRIAATHELIAEGSGSTRESVSKIITELREAGLIETGYRSIVISDLLGLAAIAGT